jgi:hypothetical protein
MKRKFITALFLPFFFIVVLIVGLYFFTRLGVTVAYNNAKLRRIKRERVRTVQKKPIAN